jgi:hypothetical protein
MQPYGNTVLVPGPNNALIIQAYPDSSSRYPALLIGSNNIGTLPTDLQTITGSVLITGSFGVTGSLPPATRNSAGNPGMVAWDITGVYVCVSQSYWLKATLSSF